MTEFVQLSDGSLGYVLNGCPRCDGGVLPDRLYDSKTSEQTPTLRCIACGHHTFLDPVALPTAAEQAELEKAAMPNSVEPKAA